MQKKTSTNSFELGNIKTAINEEPAYTSSDIKEYSDALRREIHYLKLGKGKRYKIVNGIKLNKTIREYIHIHLRWRQNYIFRMMHQLL